MTGADLDPQQEHDLVVEVEWGVAGARSAVEGPDRADVVVVVDVLSFSTSVTVACEQGARVWPHPGGEAAHELARSLEAVLAGTRSHTDVPSLSPASLTALPAGTRLVLPSPNGSLIAHALMGSPALVLIGCLRNATALARWVVGQAGGPGRPFRVALVPAGERWGDGSLRVAYEDFVGAGAVVDALVSAAATAGLSARPSAQAGLARLAFTHREPLSATTSGRELAERGFAGDVELAEQVDVCDVVPVLRNGSFSADR